MASIRSRIFLFLLRNRNLLKFRLGRKPEIDWDTSIPELREKTEKAGKMFGKLPKDIDVSSAETAKVNGEWISRNDSPEEKVILYFHGGGYVIGSAEGHRVHVAKVVAGSGVKALVFDYRLAPENPFPAALEDSIYVYKRLLDKGITPSNIVFMGDSAGGGLFLATLLALKDKKMELPSAAVALSPWTDLKCTGESLKTNAEVDTLSWAESWTVFSHYYARDEERTNPHMSPLYGDLKGFPPLLIFAGNDETLRDDSTRFAKKAEEAGVEVKITVGEKMFHCYPICSPIFPEAKEAMDEICVFIRKSVGLE